MGRLGDISNDNQANKDNIKFVVPLKLLSSFWRSPDMAVIHCKIKLILTWSKNCVILWNAWRDAVATTELHAANVSNVKPALNVWATSAVFQIADTKLYVPVVTLSNKNDKKLLEQLISVFKRTVKWNNYRSQMTIKSNSNNLNYLIDPTFTDYI